MLCIIVLNTAYYLVDMNLNVKLLKSSTNKSTDDRSKR